MDYYDFRTKVSNMLKDREDGRKHFIEHLPLLTAINEDERDVFLLWLDCCNLDIDEAETEMCNFNRLKNTNTNSSKNTLMEFQLNLLKKLKSGEMDYGDASVYTVLLDLISDNGVEDILVTMYEVCQDIDAERENEFREHAHKILNA